MTTPVIIDGIAIAVLAGFALLGAKRGLLRTLAGLLVMVLSLAGAGIIASALSVPAAKAVAPVIEKRLENRLEEAFEERMKLPEAGRMPEAGELPLTELLNLLGVDQERWDVLTDRAEESIRETGAPLVTAVIESVAQSILYGVLYALSFILLSIALHLLVRLMDAVLELPGLHGLNAWGGGLLGLLQGVLLVFLAVWVLRLLGVSFEEEGGLLYGFFTGRSPLSALKFLGA